MNRHLETMAAGEGGIVTSYNHRDSKNCRARLLAMALTRDIIYHHPPPTENGCGKCTRQDIPYNRSDKTAIF